MLKLFHNSEKGGLILEAFEKPSNHDGGYDLEYQVTRYENVGKFLEALPKFVSIQKFCEGQVVMQCFWHLEKLNMIWLTKKKNNNWKNATNNCLPSSSMSNPFNKSKTKRRSNLNKCIFYQASTILILLHYHPHCCIGGC